MSKASRLHSRIVLGRSFFRRFFGDQDIQPQRSKGVGSGVIISEDGYILTNNHVVANADTVKILLSNGKGYVPRSSAPTRRATSRSSNRCAAREASPSAFWQLQGPSGRRHGDRRWQPA